MDPSRIKDLELDFAGGGRKQNKLARSRDMGFAAMSHNQIEKLENFFGKNQKKKKKKKTLHARYKQISFFALNLTHHSDGPNFLAKAVEYLSVRTKTCASSCVICDGALVC